MKRNIIDSSILFCLVALMMSVSSEVQATGRVLIRKAPGAEAKIQAPNGKGFNSDWVTPEVQKAPVPMKFTTTPISAGKVTPENPKETRTAVSKVPHYVSEVEFKGELFINVQKVGDQYRVMLPEPAGFCSKIPSSTDVSNGESSNQEEDISLRIIHTPEEVFLSGEMNRIVVWNGKEDESGEQLLICSDRPRSTTGQKEAVLSIVPLPGEPLDIRRVSNNFNALQAKLEEIAFGNNHGVGHVHPDWNGRIASYCVQSFEVDNLEDFLYQAENIVSNLYGNTARLQWQPSQLSAIQLLLNRNYKWFAIDVSLLREWVTITEPIAYQTKSDKVCVPLLDGRIGGANSRSLTSVIVITPQKVVLNDKDGLSNKEVRFLTNKPIEISVESLQYLSPEAAAFCKKHKIEKVFVQQLFIRDYITKYLGDLIMVNASEEKLAQQPVAETPTTNPAEQKDKPQAGSVTEPAKNNDAKPAEKYQGDKPAPRNDKQSPDKSKKEIPPA